MVTGFLLPVSIFATQETGLNLKIGYVDLDRVMAKSAVIRRTIDAVQEGIKKERESMTEKLTRYKVLSDAYEQQKTILTDEQRKTRRKELDDLKIEIENQRDKINRVLRRSESEVVEPTLERIDRAIAAVGKEAHYDLILRSDAVLYASERCDITDKIIQKIETLDKEKAVQEIEETPTPEPSPGEVIETAVTPIPTPVPSPTSEGIIY